MSDTIVMSFQKEIINYIKMYNHLANKLDSNDFIKVRETHTWKNRNPWD